MKHAQSDKRVPWEVCVLELIVFRVSVYKWIVKNSLLNTEEICLCQVYNVVNHNLYGNKTRKQ